MESSHQNKEALPKKPTQTESVEKLISKKQAEKASEGMKAVQESAQGIQTEVADVMGGVEAPKETISEVKGESGEKGDISGGGGQSDDDDLTTQITGSVQRALPSQEIMIKKIRTAINSQIKVEMKKALKLKKNLTTGSAQEYNSSIAKIRRLKETLASLVTSTFEKIKTTYFRYFGADGRRKRVEDL